MVGDPRIVYSAYHAVFQIYQKEVGVIVNYVKLLNERLNFCRIVDCRYDVDNDYEHAIVVKNDVINIRVLYPSNSIIQTNCNLYLSHYNNSSCSCIVLYECLLQTINFF